MQVKYHSKVSTDTEASTYDPPKKNQVHTKPTSGEKKSFEDDSYQASNPGVSQMSALQPKTP